MEESKVTVDGVTYEIPRPFMVIATQNPMGFVGTYPLPEAQMDRFALRIRMGYPSSEDEMAILRARRSGDPMDTVRALPDGQAVALLAAVTEEVRVAPAIEEYIVRLVSATREREELSLGASPRASLSLMKLGRAKALLSHRHYVIPEDIVDLFPETVAHRVTLTRQATASGTTAEAILRDILAATPVPFLSRANV
jgi:MoxR-like ATPase